MNIGFHQQPEKKQKDVQPKPKDVFISLLHENFSPEQTPDFPNLQYMTTLEIAYKFEEMTDISKSSLSSWLLGEGYHTTSFEGNIAWQIWTK